MNNREEAQLRVLLRGKASEASPAFFFSEEVLGSFHNRVGVIVGTSRPRRRVSAMAPLFEEKMDESRFSPDPSILIFLGSIELEGWKRIPVGAAEI